MSVSTDKRAISSDESSGVFASVLEYLVDTGQRGVLFLDVMRQPGLQYRLHIAKTYGDARRRRALAIAA